MKRMRTIVCCFIMAFVLSVPMVVMAGADNTAPIVTSIRVVNNPVTRPGIARFEIGFKEEDTGVDSVSVAMDHIKSISEEPTPSPIIDQQEAGGKDCSDKPLFTGKHVVEIPITERFKEGQWCISVYISDVAGNTNNYSWSYHNGQFFLGDYKSSQEADRLEYQPMVVKDEFPDADELTITNPRLVERIKALRNDQAARVILKGGTTLPKAAFDAIKGTNKTIVAVGEQYRWVFRGSDVKRPTKNVDLSMSIETVEKSRYDTPEDIVLVRFANNGVLPGKAEIRIKTDYLYNLYNVKGRLYLYYLNSGLTELQSNPNFDTVFDGTDKWCHFDVYHNSTYAVAGSSLGKMDFNLLTPDTTYVIGGNTYRAYYTKYRRVAFHKSKNAKSVVIPASVTIDGVKYDVSMVDYGAFVGTKTKTVTIGKNVRELPAYCFQGSKVKTLIIKTKLLTGNRTYGCFRKSKVKTVKVKVGKKSANKKYIKKYKKFFAKKESGRKVKVK